MAAVCGVPCDMAGSLSATAMTAAPVISAIERFILFPSMGLTDRATLSTCCRSQSTFSAAKRHDRARVASFFQCLLYLAHCRLSVTLCFLDVSFTLQLGAAGCLTDCTLGLANCFIGSALDLVRGSTTHHALPMNVSCQRQNRIHVPCQKMRGVIFACSRD